MGTKQRGDDRRESIYETAVAVEGSLDRGLRIVAKMIARDVMSHQPAPYSPAADRKATVPARDEDISRPRRN